jgi:hypothetical protein
MRWPRLLLSASAWLIPTFAAYALILTSDQRGTGMSGVLLFVVAAIGGAACLLNVIAIFIAAMLRRDRERFRRFVMWMAAAAWFAGMLPVLYHGRTLYLRDQEEGKRFVEQRIAEAQQRRLAGRPWPTTQDDFLAGHSPPRILREKHFYHFKADDQFETVIPVDFDGGWIYHSRRGQWYRSR